MGTVYHISTDLQRHTATNKPWSEGISVTYTRRSEPPPAGRLRRAKPSSTAQHRHPLDPPTEPRLQRSWHTHLTHRVRLFPSRSPRRSSANAAHGGLEPPAVERFRRAYLHLSHSTASRSLDYMTRPLSTFVAHQDS